MKHKFVLVRTTHDKLVEDATRIVSSLDIHENLLSSLGIADEDLIRLDMVGKEWPKLVALVKGGTRGAEFFDEAMAFHFALSTRMATHMRLAFENTSRTQWLAGSLLSTEPRDAQRAANLLHEHLHRVPVLQRTNFESGMLADQQMMLELDLFREQKLPTVLWGCNGRFGNLFHFLAPRFLSNPNTVLGCEGIHSRWQWFARVRRACKLPLINGCLRLQWRLHEGTLPPLDELLPHFQDGRQAFALEHKVWKEAGAAHGSISHAAWMKRFNLSLHDANLLKAARHNYTEQQPKKRIGLPTAARFTRLVGCAAVLGVVCESERET